jgi:prefoldin subunit 5
MSSIQRRIAAVSDSAAHLVAQLRELDELREQVRKALQLRAPRRKKRNRKITTTCLFETAGQETRACQRP